MESSSGSGTPTILSENSDVTSTGLVSVPNGASNQASWNRSIPFCFASNSALHVTTMMGLLTEQERKFIIGEHEKSSEFPRNVEIYHTFQYQ